MNDDERATRFRAVVTLLELNSDYLKPFELSNELPGCIRGLSGGMGKERSEY